MLDGDVVPVVLIDSAVSFVASPTPPFNVTDVFSIGVVTAPVINTIMADTGPLPVGSYTIQFWYYVEVDKAIFELQWRDAPNTATLRAQRFSVSGGQGTNPTVNNFQLSTRYTIENVNERFRVQTVLAPVAGQDHQATLLVKL